MLPKTLNLQWSLSRIENPWDAKWKVLAAGAGCVGLAASWFVVRQHSKLGPSAGGSSSQPLGIRRVHSRFHELERTTSWFRHHCRFFGLCGFFCAANYALAKAWLYKPLFILFNVPCGLFSLAMLQTAVEEPGKVPPNYAMQMGDEAKRRRYCKICEAWKPDRCHHCSICERCILNMDQHCPWVGNCVGFYNRKFFMQANLYGLFLTTTVASAGWLKFISLVCSGNARSLEFALTGIGVVFASLLPMALKNFVKFHLKLVLENYTTIENLQRKEGEKSMWDIGRRSNWEQVFGEVWWAWLLPVHSRRFAPVGNGVRWRLHYTRVRDDEDSEQHLIIGRP